MKLPQKVIQSTEEWVHKHIIRNNGYAAYLRKCEKHNVEPLVTKEEAEFLLNGKEQTN